MNNDTKICRIEDLTTHLDIAKQDGQRIVLCHGVFDVFHVGHLRHLEQAKAQGDVLVVTLTPDRFVNKGPGRPAFTESLRAEMIASLSCVDYVAINRWPTAVEPIQLLQPDVFVKGSEFKDLNDTIGHVSHEAEAVQAVGGRIVFTEDVVFSSSALINSYLSQQPNHVREYLTKYASRYTAEATLAALRRAEKLRVLVIGETIIDEYDYCEALGKSGKEPVLASRRLSMDRFAGGVLACANHAASFADKVDVFTLLGEGRDEEAFIRSSLKTNVNLIAREKPHSPTIVKKRFVEKYLSQKMFEVYQMNDEPLDPQSDYELCAHLESILPNYDVVIVADYGHGMLSPGAVDLLTRKAKFLSVNTQSNAGNHGFNMISKYERADYVCLAGREFALETRSRRFTDTEMISHVSDLLHCPRVMMTRGNRGCLYFTKPNQYASGPALATQVVDRVGAGDAVLCVTTLAVALGAPPDVVTFLANVVGAEAVTILGNQRSIERIPLYRHIECMLKMHHGNEVESEFADAELSMR